MTRLLAFLLLCACGCAATNGTLVSAPLPGQPSTPTAGVRPDAASAGRPLSVSAAPSDTLISFSMPRVHALRGLALPDTGNPLSEGYRRWELAYSTRAKACRDSGSAWRRDIRNFGAWRPGAQIVPFRSGYAAPGQHVTVDSILVSSFSWPFALWARAWTDVPGRWTYITERVSN